uniref:Uncharacterized protein n=1 Tax=Amazona collaria TaxID=241587 RepID=A0A8B9FAY7_9PSIT
WVLPDFIFFSFNPDNSLVLWHDLESPSSQPVLPSYSFGGFSFKLLGESLNYKAVPNCLTNWLYIEESNRSRGMKNTDSVRVTLLLGSSE